MTRSRAALDTEGRTVKSERPWKAEADVFDVTRSTDDFIQAMVSAAGDLVLDSADPACRFYAQAKEVQAPKGRAVVVTDIAEYATSGAKKSAVVVSGLVEEGSEGTRTLTIRTHLEDQLTRFEGDVIVFDEHHDLIREALMSAVLEVEPAATHRQGPRDPASTGSANAEPTAVRPRFSAEIDAGEVPPRFDARSLAGMGLLGLGVLVLLVAVASGSWPLIIAALIVTGALGWAGNRIAGS